jgi:hypothetical protein
MDEVKVIVDKAAIAMGVVADAMIAEDIEASK